MQCGYYVDTPGPYNGEYIITYDRLDTENDWDIETGKPKRGNYIKVSRDDRRCLQAEWVNGYYDTHLYWNLNYLKGNEESIWNDLVDQVNWTCKNEKIKDRRDVILEVIDKFYYLVPNENLNNELFKLLKEEDNRLMEERKKEKEDDAKRETSSQEIKENIEENEKDIKETNQFTTEIDEKKENEELDKAIEKEMQKPDQKIMEKIYQSGEEEIGEYVETIALEQINQIEKISKDNELANENSEEIDYEKIRKDNIKIHTNKNNQDEVIKEETKAETKKDNVIVEKENVKSETQKEGNERDLGQTKEYLNSGLTISQKLALFLEKRKLLMKIPIIEKFVEKNLKKLPEPQTEIDNILGKTKEKFSEYLTRNGYLREHPPKIRNDKQEERDIALKELEENKEDAKEH